MYNLLEKNHLSEVGQKSITRFDPETHTSRQVRYEIKQIQVKNY